MAKARKTIEVSSVLRMTNFYLKNSPDSEQRERYAIANLCEGILTEANAYAGFGYLDSANVTNGVDGFQADDESRRVYYGKH